METKIRDKVEGISGTRDKAAKSGTVLEILGHLEPMSNLLAGTA